MNNLAKSWVKALRSEEYIQASGALRVDFDAEDVRMRDDVEEGDSGFCCLGVLCDIYNGDGKAEWDGGSYGDQESYPPSIINDAVGFVADTDFTFAKLAELNDGRGYYFDEIADYIEDYFGVGAP